MIMMIVFIFLCWNLNKKKIHRALWRPKKHRNQHKAWKLFMLICLRSCLHLPSVLVSKSLFTLRPAFLYRVTVHICVICPCHCLQTWAVPCVRIWLTCGLWGWAGLAAGLWSSPPIRRCSRETTTEWRASTTCRPSLMPRTAATTPAQAAQSRWTGRHKEQADDPCPRSVIFQTCK